ncbi:MAG: glycosyltransferase family 2 protein [Candidatus Helarchaeota archaeon]
MDSIKVSIVTPSLNQGKYIEETIQSVLNQTYPNIEYIIVDGGSTDSTNKILQKYQNKFKLIQGQDEGQTDAINIGMKASTGHLVGWINSDDVYEPECVEKIVKGYHSNPNASIYYGAIRLINEEGRFIGFPKWGPLTYKRLIKGLPAVWQPGSFYPLNLVKKVGYLNTDLFMLMDYELYLKLLKHAPALFIPEFIARQRVHSLTKTTRYQHIAFKEGVIIRKRFGATPIDLLYYCLRKTAYLTKFYIINRGKVVTWDDINCIID